MKLFAIGAKFWARTDARELSFKLDGQAFRIRSTFILESPWGEELFKIEEKTLRVCDRM
jgi:uncharacterized protein YxjI